MKRRTSHSASITVGWLFADLLLALAMLFLITNTTMTPPKVKAHIVPTPIVTPTPTPRPIPRLELQPHRFVIHIDVNGFLSNSPDAINSAKQQIRSQSFLNGRNAGLAIAYGGAPDISNISLAQSIATKTYDVLKSLGQEHFAFANASYYNEKLYRLGDLAETVTIDVFLFVH